MPLFAAFIGTIVTALSSLFLRFFLAKVGLLTLGLGALTSLSVGFVAFFNQTLSPLVASAFSTQYGQFLGLAFPPIAGTCIATIMTAITFVSAYKLKVRYVKMATGMA